MTQTATRLHWLNAALGIKPPGTVYAVMCAPADSFDAWHDEEWFAVWYRVYDNGGNAVRITTEEARVHFAALGQAMPEPTWPR